MQARKPPKRLYRGMSSVLHVLQASKPGVPVCMPIAVNMVPEKIEQYRRRLARVLQTKKPPLVLLEKMTDDVVEGMSAATIGDLVNMLHSASVKKVVFDLQSLSAVGVAQFKHLYAQYSRSQPADIQLFCQTTAKGCECLQPTKSTLAIQSVWQTFKFDAATDENGTPNLDSLLSSLPTPPKR